MATQTSRHSARLLCYSALMCALIIVSTLWIRFPIPGTDVMFTTQVFLAGGQAFSLGQLLPPRYCLYTLLLYVGMGLAGVPVFSSICGPAVLSTPSFGYLLGFIVAAPAEAFFRQKMQKKQSRDFLAALLGIVVIYAVALPYVAILKGAFLSAPVPFSVLMYSYFLVFLPLDLVKAFLAGLLGRRLRIALRMN